MLFVTNPFTQARIIISILIALRTLIDSKLLLYQLCKTLSQSQSHDVYYTKRSIKLKYSVFIRLELLA